jgi:hypothetical protein
LQQEIICVLLKINNNVAIFQQGDELVNSIQSNLSFSLFSDLR